MQKFITVRMEEGEEPNVKVYGRGSYYHSKEGVTVPTGGCLEAEAPWKLRELLSAILDGYDADLVAEVQAAEILGAAESCKW